MSLPVPISPKRAPQRFGVFYWGFHTLTPAIAAIAASTEDLFHRLQRVERRTGWGSWPRLIIL